MLTLAGTSDKIRVTSSAAVTTDVHASHNLLSGTTVTPGRTNTAITTATTTDVVASPTGTDRINVRKLNIRNKHASSSQTITVIHTDGTTAVELFKCTLFAGEELVYADERWQIYDASGQPVMAAVAVRPATNDFRLSGVSATPIMTSDSTSLSTVYLAPFRGNVIALYDGANWQLISPPSEVSLAVTGRTTDLPFDVFGYLSAGTVALEFLDWTSATARATGLSRLNGVWTKTGDSTRRYLGSIRARSATTFHWVQFGSALPVKLDVFNADNRVDLGFTLIDTADTFTYTTATWRQWNGSTNFQVDVMVGLQEEMMEVEAWASSRNSTISIPRQVGIGYDVTNAIGSGANPASGGWVSLCAETANVVASIESHQQAVLRHTPAIGRHFYAWLQISTATGTCTWIGDDAALRLQSGMSGSWRG